MGFNGLAAHENATCFRIFMLHPPYLRRPHFRESVTAPERSNNLLLRPHHVFPPAETQLQKS